MKTLFKNPGVTRRERNKFAAAKSRANRKLQFDSMQRDIDELKAANAALLAQIQDLMTRTTIVPEPYQIMEVPGEWTLLSNQEYVVFNQDIRAVEFTC